MFVIVQGTVLLFRKTMNTQRLVGTLGAGEMVGEKAILSETPYKRSMTAVAKSEVTVMELDAKSVKLIAGRLPDFNLKVLGLVVARLDEANEMIGILQLKNPAERVVQYILYFCRKHYKKVPQGFEISLTVDAMSDTINVTNDIVEQCCKDMVAQKILIEKKDGFVVSDETALISYLPQLKDRIAA